MPLICVIICLYQITESIKASAISVVRREIFLLRSADIPFRSPAQAFVTADIRLCKMLYNFALFCYYLPIFSNHTIILHFLLRYLTHYFV